MGYLSAPVAIRLHPSVRRHLTAYLTVASAGILALGLVTAPPDVDAVRSEVRAVHLAASALPNVAQRWDDLLRDFILSRGEPSVAKTSGGSAGVPVAVVETPTTDSVVPPTFDSPTDPASSTQKVDATALAATTTALSLPAPLLAIIGPILLFGPLIVLVILACPPCALINFLSYFLPLPTIPLAAAASTATVEAAVAPTLTSEPPLQANETKTAGVSEPATSHDKPSGTESKTSAGVAKDVDETAGTERASTEESGAVDAESPADDSEPTKSTEPPATPRRVVRDSLGTEKKTSDPSHRGNGGPATSEEPADGRAATAGSSSADSDSPDSPTKGHGSSEGGSGDA